MQQINAPMRRFIAFLLVLTFVAQPALAAKRAPSSKEALRFMLVHGNVALDKDSCASVKDPDDRTLTDYVSHVLNVQTDRTIRWNTEVTAKAAGGGPDRWRIDVKFYGADAGDQYDMGVRFVMDRAKRVIVPSSVMCTGTS
jgi:hypothetical protein